MARIPMMPVPLRKAKRIGERFRGIGDRLAKPGLDVQLKHAEIEMNAAEYMGLAFFFSMFYGVLIGTLVTALTYAYNANLLVGPVVALATFAASMFFISSHPRLVNIRIAKATDRDMLAAMRHLMIQVRSGVPLFNAMASITNGYGRVSVEFDKIVRDINAGTKELDALNNAAERNSSLFFRRATWQLVNAMRAGSDIGETMESITENFAKMQAVRIRQYGQELNPWTMMYMIIAVIVPSLGITFLVVLSSFSGLTVPTMVFPLIIVGLILFQFFFMGFIKTKRPNISV